MTTADEFRALPAAENAERWLIRGRLMTRPMPNTAPLIQGTALALARHLDRWVSALPAPGVEVWSDGGYTLAHDPDTCVRFPLAVVPGRPHFDDAGWTPALPSVAVEVICGPERCGDMWDRTAEYMRCGVPLLWLLYPHHGYVTVHRPGAAVRAVNRTGTLTAEAELPGFACPVAELFE